MGVRLGCSYRLLGNPGINEDKAVCQMMLGRGGDQSNDLAFDAHLSCDKAVNDTGGTALRLVCRTWSFCRCRHPVIWHLVIWHRSVIDMRTVVMAGIGPGIMSSMVGHHAHIQRRWLNER